MTEKLTSGSMLLPLTKYSLVDYCLQIVFVLMSKDGLTHAIFVLADDRFASKMKGSELWEQ